MVGRVAGVADVQCCLHAGNAATHHHDVGVDADRSGFQHLVEELFDLVMLETGQMQPAFEPVQLLDLAQDVVLKFKSRAQEAGIDLKLDSPQALPLLRADIAMLERVLNNLIENALRFTPRGGIICLKLRLKKRGVNIAVEDSDCGIAPEDLPHIFERFYRADKSRTRSDSTGFGLGLSIACWIVQNHDGEIQVESEPGQGTTFCVRLPLIDPPIAVDP